MITKKDIEKYVKFTKIGKSLVERANEIFNDINYLGNPNNLLVFGVNSKAYQIKEVHDEKIDVLYADTKSGDSRLITLEISWFLDDKVFLDWLKHYKGENDEKKKKEEEKLRKQKELLDYNQYLELKERFEETGVNGFKPFDLVLYKPKNEEGIVKSITGCGIFVLFRIQSTAALCKPEDLEKL